MVFTELLMDPPPKQRTQAALGVVEPKATATKPDCAQALTIVQRLPASVVRIADEAPICPTATKARSGLRRVTTRGEKLPSEAGSKPTSWKVVLLMVPTSRR